MATFQELRVAYEEGDWAGAAAVGAAWAGAVECSHLSQSRAQIVTDSCTAVNVCSYAGFRPTPWPHPLSCVPAGSSVRSAAGPVAEGVDHGSEGQATGGGGVEARHAQQQTQQQIQQQAQQQEWEGRYSGGGSSCNSAPAADDAYRATQVLSAGPSMAEVLSHAVREAPHDVQLLVALGEEMCRMGKVRLWLRRGKRVGKGEEVCRNGREEMGRGRGGRKGKF